MSGAFYPASRAHHAYSMAIDFGMKFLKRDGLWSTEGILTVTGAGGYQIVVAEESLNLLLPMAGDIILFGDHKGHAEPHMVVETDFTGDENDENVALFESFEPSWWNWNILVNRSIILRNGKPFHWPECGE